MDPENGTRKRLFPTNQIKPVAFRGPTLVSPSFSIRGPYGGISSWLFRFDVAIVFYIYC